MIHASPKPICSYKVKAHAALLEMNAQTQCPNTLPYTTVVMTCTLSLQLQKGLLACTCLYWLVAKVTDEEPSQRRGVSTHRLRALSGIKA